MAALVDQLARLLVCRGPLHLEAPAVLRAQQLLRDQEVVVVILDHQDVELRPDQHLGLERFSHPRASPGDRQVCGEYLCSRSPDRHGSHPMPG